MTDHLRLTQALLAVGANGGVECVQGYIIAPTCWLGQRSVDVWKDITGTRDICSLENWLLKGKLADSCVWLEGREAENTALAITPQREYE